MRARDESGASLDEASLAVGDLRCVLQRISPSERALLPPGAVERATKRHER